MREALRVKMGTWAMASVVLFGALSASGQTQEAIATNARDVETTARETEVLLARRISVRLERRSLKQAIDEVGRHAGVRISYALPLVERYTDPITVQDHNTPLGVVFAHVLAGTTLRVVGVPGERLAVVESDAVRDSTQGNGTIVGRVVDSATAQGLDHVTVLLAGAKSGVVTDERGRFVIANVPAGGHALVAKHIGYRSLSKAITVKPSDSTVVRIAMPQVSSILSAVVTTATGIQQRLNVGNAITTLNVDEIRRNAPINNLTDLLDGRVPDLMLNHGSGAPGAPARVRIRGNGSLTQSNDPIIVVDGVRVYSSQTANGSDVGYSVLNNIDINSVQTVDVLKGPSASALYGSDAANGVIVVTTKRGQPGKTHWAFSTDQNWSTQPPDFPESVYLEGIALSGGLPARCVPGFSVCHDTRVIRYNLLDDDRTTVFGTGRMQSYAASVSGGSNAVQYFFGGTASSELGLFKMPEASVDYLTRTTGRSVPDWQRRPQRYETDGGTATLTLNPMPSLTMNVTSALDRTQQTVTPLASAIYSYLESSAPRDSIVVAGSLPRFRQQGTLQELGIRTTLGADWHPASWLTAQGEAGLQNLDRNSTSLLRRGDCPTGCGDDNGSITEQNDTRSVGTVNVRASAQLPRRAGIQLTPRAGLNYVRTHQQDRSVTATGLPLGGTTTSGALMVQSQDSAGTPIQAGVFFQMGLSLLDRLNGSVGTRIDASNSLGRNVSPAYPKLDVSYIVPIERVVPTTAISLFRLRAAYGHSAVQPDLGASLRTYGGINGIGDNGVVLPVLDLTTLGNPSLRPERYTELEGGFDLSMLNDRVTIATTLYRKLSRDAIVSIAQPPSLGGGSGTVNLGSVRNAGGDLSVEATLVDRSAFSWGGTVSYARNTNTLAKLAPGYIFSTDLPIGTWYGTRAVQGYPLDGVWLRPVVTYADANGDGVIAQEELIRADSAVFVGGPLPQYDMNFFTHVGFWRGRVTFAVQGQFENGAGQVNETLLDNLTNGTLPALNDPATSLEEQARFRSGYALLHTVHVFRLQSFSMRVAVPDRYARRVMRASSASVALQGTNLGVWTNYSGADPDVSKTIAGNETGDAGTLPLPRKWGINVSLTY